MCCICEGHLRPFIARLFKMVTEYRKFGDVCTKKKCLKEILIFPSKYHQRILPADVLDHSNSLNSLCASVQPLRL